MPNPSFVTLLFLSASLPLSALGNLNLPSNLKNVAENKNDWLSTTHPSYSESYVNDGDTSQSVSHCSQTAHPDTDDKRYRFWRVDLGDFYKIYYVKIYNVAHYSNKAQDNWMDTWLENFAVNVAPSMNDKYAPHLENEKRCLYHEYDLGAGAVATLNCDAPVIGRYVTIYKEAWQDITCKDGGTIRFCKGGKPLILCEVQVWAIKITVLKLGETCGEDTLERPTTCDPNTCAEGPTRGSTKKCKIPLGGNCNTAKTRNQCAHPYVCRDGKCRIDYLGNCEKKTAYLCRRGTSCQNKQCRVTEGSSCSENRDACVQTTVCDSLDVCKKAADSRCDDTSDCVSGADCNSRTKKCQCRSDSSKADSSGNGLCPPKNGRVTGACLPGNPRCSDPNALCKDGACTCDNKLVFRNNYTCNVNAACVRNSDCGPDNICENPALPNAKCALGYGQSCGKDQFMTCTVGTTCDQFSCTCRIALTKDCSTKPNLCVTGAECEQGTRLCKSALGENCTSDNQCLKGTQCDSRFKNTCRLATGSNCERGYEGLCLSTALCDDDYTCRQKAGESCGEERPCVLGFECEEPSYKCKVRLLQNCSQHRRDCVKGAACDALNACGLKDGSPCKMTGEVNECAAGATCKMDNSGTSSSCQCNATLSTKTADSTCSPKPDLIRIGQSCTADVNCQDPNAVCSGGTCQCKADFAVEPSSFSCRIKPGRPCVSKEGKCLKSCVCNAGAVCRLKAGQSCDGDYRGFCTVNTVCEDRVCKLTTNEDCSGPKSNLCRSGAVCDFLKKCSLPAGSKCSNVDVVEFCPAGSFCKNATCQCRPTSAKETSQKTCVPKRKKSGGLCHGVPLCDDSNAECQDMTCACNRGYAIDFSFNCRKAVGQQCVSNDDCVKGTVCDNRACKHWVGMKCERNETCVSGTICDVLGFCKLELKQSCSSTLSPHCRRGTVCDNLYTCALRLDSPCSDDDSCAAGAVCRDLRCRCSDIKVALPNGGLCLPVSGRVGGECSPILPCADPNANCKDGVCVCQAGSVNAIDYSCRVGKSEEESSVRLTVGVVAAVVIAIGCGLLLSTYFRFRTRKHKKERVEETRSRRQSMLALTEEANAVVSLPKEPSESGTVQSASSSEMTATRGVIESMPVPEVTPVGVGVSTSGSEFSPYSLTARNLNYFDLVSAGSK